MIISLKYFLWLLLVIFTCGTVQAQHYHFYNFGMSEGLPGSFVYSVYEDSEGYFWILTDKGVARFDGKSMIHYNAKDGYDDAGAYQILEDRKGEIWILTVDFNVYVLRNKRFERVETDIKIGWLFLDKEGKVWASVRNYYNYNPLYQITDQLHLKKQLIAVKDLPYNFVQLNQDSFIIAAAHGIYLAVKGMEGQKILEARSFVDHVQPRIFMAKNACYITNANGIYRLNRKTLKPELVYDLTDNEVYSAFFDEVDEMAMFGTKKGLLRIWGINSKRVQVEQYLPAHPVSSVIRSKDQVYWIATFDKGIFTCNFRSSHITSKEGLPGERINHVAGEHGNLYFIGTYDICKYKGGVLSPFTLPYPDHLKKTKQYIRSAYEIGDSMIIINAQVNFRIKQAKAAYINSQIPLNADWSNTVSQIRYNKIYESFSQKLMVNDSQYLGFLKQVSMSKLTLKDRVPVFIDGDTFYFHYTKGLIKVYWKQTTPVIAPIYISSPVSGMVKLVNSFVISTYTNGIYILDDKGILKNYSSIQGLLSDCCNKSIVHKDIVWVCTNKGLARINSFEPFNTTNFTARDYLVNNEVHDVRIFNDTVYAATSEGVSIFSAKEKYTSYTPSVYLDRVEVNNRDTFFEGTFVVPYDKNNFTFHFSTPGYRSGNANIYRFVISNAGSADTGYYANGTIQLSSLKPGTYLIAVSAKNIDGFWSIKPYSFYLTIKKPFWKTTGFIAGIFVFCSLIMLVWIRSSIIRFKREMVYQRKLTESELRSLRLYMNPHFIFNSLTTLQSFVLTGNSTMAAKFLGTFSRLLRAVMGYSIKGELTLSEEIKLLTDYLELEKTRFINRFEYRISYAEHIYPDNIIIPSLLIQPFVENAVKHAFPDEDIKDGKLEVYFYQEGSELWCRVEDNGVGRKDVKSINENHLSTGIKFTEERIKLLLNKPVKEVIKIIDKYEDNKQAGTCVLIRIPDLTNK